MLPKESDPFRARFSNKGFHM